MSIEPTTAHENESVSMSGPLQQWPTIEHKQLSGPCATAKTSWHQMPPGKALHQSTKGCQNVDRHNAAHHP